MWYGALGMTKRLTAKYAVAGLALFNEAVGRGDDSHTQCLADSPLELRAVGWVRERYAEDAHVRDNLPAVGVIAAQRLEQRVEEGLAGRRCQHLALERVCLQRRARARPRDAAQRLDDAGGPPIPRSACRLRGRRTPRPAGRPSIGPGAPSPTGRQARRAIRSTLPRPAGDPPAAG